MSFLVVLLLFGQLATPGLEWSVDEYMERLETAIKNTSAAANSPYESERAVQALQNLKGAIIRFPGEEAVRVHNRWVDDAVQALRVDSTGEAAQKILARLEAVKREISQIRGAESSEVSAELATGEEFGETASKPKIEDVDLGIKDSLRDLAEWLRKRLETEPDMRRPATISVPRAVAWIIAVAVVCLLVFFIVRHIMRGRGFGSPEFSGGPRVRSLLEDALKRTPEQWKELARQYFDKSDFTQALRALYLGLLVVLHRKRLISYDTSRTNWEYVWELGTAKPEHEPFAELTRAFDYKWYGRESCTRGDYLALESRADGIIAASADAGANEQRTGKTQ